MTPVCREPAAPDFGAAGDPRRFQKRVGCQERLASEPKTLTFPSGPLTCRTGLRGWEDHELSALRASPEWSSSAFVRLRGDELDMLEGELESPVTPVTEPGPSARAPQEARSATPAPPTAGGRGPCRGYPGDVPG